VEAHVRRGPESAARLAPARPLVGVFVPSPLRELGLRVRGGGGAQLEGEVHGGQTACPGQVVLAPDALPLPFSISTEPLHGVVIVPAGLVAGSAGALEQDTVSTRARGKITAGHRRKVPRTRNVHKKKWAGAGAGAIHSPSSRYQWKHR